MADPFNPYAAPPASDNNPYAVNPYSVIAEKPPWYTDVAKTVGPSAIRGLTGLLTTAPTMAELTGLGIEKAADYIPWISPETAEHIKAGGKFAQEHAAPYSYGGVKQKIEENVTGPLYEAQTVPGKIAQNTIEIAPALVGGGVTGVVPKVANLRKPVEMAVRALAGGAGATGGEWLGEKGVEAGVLPEWAPSLMKAGGGVAGVTAGPRLVTPLPATPEHARAVQALRGAGVTGLTPAQTTGRPGLYQLESNLREKPLIAKDTTKFTEAAAQQAGMPTGTKTLTPEAFSEADKALAATKQAVKAAEIKGTDFADLQKAFKDVGNTAKKALHNDPGMVNVENRITQLSGSPGALSMPGPRYQQMRDELQQAISSSRGAEKDAYISMKGHLDTAMAKQLPPEMAKRHLGAANLNILKKSNLDPNQQITPAGLKKEITNQWGEEAYNTGRGMAPLTQAGERVMTRPPASTATHPIVEAGSTAMGAMGMPSDAGGWSKAAGVLGGKFAAPAVQWALKQGAKPLYFNPITQGYLGNQLLTPGQAALSPEMFIRALRAPPALPQLTVQP